METRGAPAHLSSPPPGALSARRHRPLVLPPWRSGSGPPGAFLPGAVLGKPASDVHSEFDFFRGLLLYTLYRPGHGCPAAGGGGGPAGPEPSNVAPERPAWRRGHGLC